MVTMGIDYGRILKRFEDIQPAGLNEFENLKLENAYLKQLIATQKAESIRLKRLLNVNYNPFSV